jgi:SAM-dependent methyltransferase
MKNPVTKDSFWKERLEADNELRLSVYRCSLEEWNHLTKVHENIFKAMGVGGKVLDAACGYGRLSELFTDYTGIDISETFISRAKELYPNKEFVCADLAKEVQYPSKYFDWVIAVSLKEMLIREMGEAYWNHVFEELKRLGKNVLLLEYSNPSEIELYQ